MISIRNFYFLFLYVNQEHKRRLRIEVFYVFSVELQVKSTVAH